MQTNISTPIPETHEKQVNFKINAQLRSVVNETIHCSDYSNSSSNNNVQT